MADKADWKAHASDLENELGETIRIKNDWVDRCNGLTRELLKLREEVRVLRDDRDRWRRIAEQFAGSTNGTELGLAHLEYERTQVEVTR